jgi:hypothetical protein
MHAGRGEDEEGKPAPKGGMKQTRTRTRTHCTHLSVHQHSIGDEVIERALRHEGVNGKR